MTDLLERARAILRGNDRGGYTVPTHRLYPFQWNWDSAFVAMGWATFDEARGFTEVERLLEGQWDDGLVPQIVFHAPSEDRKSTRLNSSHMSISYAVFCLKKK